MRQSSILINLFFFYFNCLPDDVLCQITFLPDDMALKSSCDKPSDLSQQVEKAYELEFDLKNMKIQYQKYQKMDSASNYI